jgi:hypothetical protein
MNKEQMIKAIIEANLNLCQSDSSYNDGFIFDLLMGGFKGLANMSMEELQAEYDHFAEEV